MRLIVWWLWQVGVCLHSFEYCVFSCAPCVSSRSPDPSFKLPFYHQACIGMMRLGTMMKIEPKKLWLNQKTGGGQNYEADKTCRLNVLRGKVCCRSLLGNWAFNLHLTSRDRISSTNTCQHFLVTLLLSQKCFPRNQDDFQRFQHCQHCCAARCGNLSALPWRK